MKGKNHMIISIHAEKAFERICPPFIVKTFKIWYRGNIFQHDKAIHDKHTANIIVNSEMVKAFHLRLDQDSPLLFKF